VIFTIRRPPRRTPKSGLTNTNVVKDYEIKRHQSRFAKDWHQNHSDESRKQLKYYI